MVITDQSVTVLEAMLSQGADIESQCRNGFCGACKTCASGEVKYLKEPLGYLAKGEILPCVCVAQGELTIN
ncbi:2Fe-2S iron-sulfur cluster-binding protein [Motilimonas eburnea]|uniref:2Fe-2S iron-sulfur cluster-binding protein n=1 Tax=Motilimonas eburnea TaxID=1737488 RepID=UPI001E613D29|nr:2Fe-2S iron-sulfur cluster-binding protein [Motilimonas eburnea]MCE2571696.1 2Fe-2S iron-sulfur cluster binding domain-containing protein [Motilimonas eburnea]